MEPLALKVVLDGTSTLDRRVDTDANDAEAEEEEHGDPFEDSYAGAFPFHLGHSHFSAVLARHFLGSPPRPLLLDLFQGHGLVLDV